MTDCRGTKSYPLDGPLALHVRVDTELASLEASPEPSHHTQMFVLADRHERKPCSFSEMGFSSG
jgi:hypothetical protein